MATGNSVREFSGIPGNLWSLKFPGIFKIFQKCHFFLDFDIFILRKTCVFGIPFVKRFALCYRSVVSLSVLSVCDVRALWPNGWTDQDETWHACRPRGPVHIVLDGNPAPPPQRGTAPQSLFCVRWGPRGVPCLLRPNG